MAEPINFTNPTIEDVVRLLGQRWPDPPLTPAGTIADFAALSRPGIPAVQLFGAVLRLVETHRSTFRPTIAEVIDCARAMARRELQPFVPAGELEGPRPERDEALEMVRSMREALRGARS